MSHPQNTKWLENATENFDQAIAERNWAQARAVVDDMFENGFDSEATTLAKEIYATQFKLSNTIDDKMADMQEDVVAESVDFTLKRKN